MRLLAAAVLAVALVALVSHARATADPAPSPAPCSAASLSAAYSGPLTVTSVDAYGCEGGWAYLWATVGTGATQISVTELLAYDSAAGRWRNMPRGLDCSASVVPSVIYHKACFSN